MNAAANKKLMQEIFAAAGNPDPAMRDRVVVEARGDNITRTGVRYDNDYCLVFHLENGKIKEVREYCDSVLTERALGPFPEPHRYAVAG